MGPISANNTANLTGYTYEGSFLIMGLLGFINFLVILMVRFPKKNDYNPTSEDDTKKGGSSSSSDEDESTTDLIRLLLYEKKEKESLRDIITKPLFAVSCTVATLAHTMMVMVMSAVTLAMTADGYSFEECSLVMQLHFFAMFGPGFVTGRLISHFGVFNVALIGGILYAASVILLEVGTSSWNYISGMMLIGVGWNLSFSSGTVMLTGCYRPCDATRVQAINDFILFSVSSAGSLASGALFASFGWSVLIYVVSGLIAGNLFLFFVAHRLKSVLDKSAEPSSINNAARVHERIVSGEFSGGRKEDIIRKLSRSGNFSVESIDREIKKIHNENVDLVRVASLTPV